MDIQCLYDCGSGSPSTQEYHIYPSSASTLEFTLPEGVVCDKCNQYFSDIESYFTNYHPGSSMRVWDGVMTRKGKTPKLNHENGQMSRTDDEHARHIQTNLSSIRFERHSNGDFTIVGGYTPLPFDASKVSRVLHKIAFETLLFYANDPQLNPLSNRFVPLRNFVRRPRSANEFQPFAWKRREGRQEIPQISSIVDPESGDVIAEVCELRFPGIAYMVAYPPWPSSLRLWESAEDANVVAAPGMTILKPEEIRIPLTKQ